MRKFLPSSVWFNSTKSLWTALLWTKFNFYTFGISDMLLKGEGIWGAHEIKLHQKGQIQLKQGGKTETYHCHSQNRHKVSVSTLQPFFKVICRTTTRHQSNKDKDWAWDNGFKVIGWQRLFSWKNALNSALCISLRNPLLSASDMCKKICVLSGWSLTKPLNTLSRKRSVSAVPEGCQSWPPLAVHQSWHLFTKHILHVRHVLQIQQ